jgi:hypothetical protein
MEIAEGFFRKKALFAFMNVPASACEGSRIKNPWVSPSLCSQLSVPSGMLSPVGNSS